MAERFQNLYRLPGQSYCDGSPVIIEAGALLKDTVSGRLLAQLKFKSVSNVLISALKVSVKAFEPNGNEVDGVKDFAYLDLHAVRDAEFGSKTPVYLPNSLTRSFTAAVTEVTFANGETVSVDSEWKALAEQKSIESFFNNADLTYGYRCLAGNRVTTTPEDVGSLWYCACGAVNLKSEEECHSCRRKYEELISALDKDLCRKAEEYDKARILIDAADSALQNNKEQCWTAIMWYDHAVSLLSALDGYRDSNDLIDICNDRSASRKQMIAEIEKKEEADRLERERQAEERRIAAEKARKKAKRVALVTVLIVAVAIAAALVANYVIIPTVRNNAYNAAVKLYKEGEYEEAITAFTALSGYKDSEAQIEKCYISKYGEEKYNLIKNIKVGDTYKFGSYEQDNNTSNGKEEIEWIVLDKDGMSLLLISKYALDYQQYNTSYTAVTWETCSLRKWLNGTFLSAAFSSEEQNSIISSTVTADKNPSYGTSPGNNTTDKVFLLNITEVNKYFSSDSSRQCQGTAYCYAQGANKASNGNCWWWLRSPGYFSNYAASVDIDGSVSHSGYSVHSDGNAVRPAMWIDVGN